MTDWPVIIKDVLGDEITVMPSDGEHPGVWIWTEGGERVLLTREQSAEVIAAITDAARIIPGEHT